MLIINNNYLLLIFLPGIIPCIVCQFGGAEVMAFSSLTVEKASATVSDPMVLLNNTLTCFDEPTRTVVCGKHTENGETTYKVFWSECHFENQNSFLALQNGNDAGKLSTFHQ